MTTSRKTLLIATLVLTSFLGGTVLADDNSGGWWPQWGMGRGMMGYGPGTVVDRIDGRLAFLKTELRITGAQSAAWDEMATVIRDTSETHNAMMRTMMTEMHDGSFFKKPLPERLQYQRTHMEARLEQLKSVQQAVDKLYAILDDTQRKAADDIVLPMMGMGMGRGMMFQNP